MTLCILVMINISCTFWYQLPKYQVDLHYTPRRVAASSCCRHVDRYGDRAFSVAAPRAWNRLPAELKLLHSTQSFLLEPRTFLFDFVYGHQDMHWLYSSSSVCSACKARWLNRFLHSGAHEVRQETWLAGIRWRYVALFVCCHRHRMDHRVCPSHEG